MEEGNHGRYRRLLQLGEGGTATVTVAVASRLAGVSKLVVLKEPRWDQPDEAIQADFVREARLSARLHHPNIVQVNEIVEHGGAPVIVMEYLEGQPLGALISAGELVLRAHLFAICECLRALEYAHTFRDLDGSLVEVVHRDVSPQNLFVTYTGDVKLLDFGIARVADESHTESGVVKGKLKYMSPEQIFGDPLDGRSDLYAVGVMLWEALHGRRMWERGLNEATVMHRIVNGELPEAALREGVPAALLELALRALSMEPEDRPASAAAFRRELLALADVSDAREVLEATMGRSFGEARKRRDAKIGELLQGMSLTHSGEIDVGWLSENTGGERAVKGRYVPYVLMACVAFASLAAWMWFRVPRGSTSASAPTQTAPAEDTVGIGGAPMGDAGLADEGAAEGTLHVLVRPLNATIELDGEIVGEGEYLARRLLDGAEHSLVVRAAGYRTFRQVFQLDRAKDINVALERQRSPENQRSRGVEMDPVNRRRCDPPYEFDARGVKLMRPECL